MCQRLRQNGELRLERIASLTWYVFSVRIVFHIIRVVNGEESKYM